MSKKTRRSLQMWLNRQGLTGLKISTGKRFIKGSDLSLDYTCTVQELKAANLPWQYFSKTRCNNRQVHAR